MALGGTCKLGRIKSGRNKGKCKLAPGKKRRTKLTGAAARAKHCAGKKGGFFKQCIRGIEAPGPTASSLYGVRRRSRR